MGMIFNGIAIAPTRIAIAGAGGSTPSAPSNLAAEGISTTQINLSWTDNSSDEDNFELQYDTDSAFGTPTTVEPAANATSHSLTTLTQGTTYYFRIRAVNTGGNSAWSNTATANTGSDLETNLVAYWDLDEGEGVRYDLEGTNDLTDNNTVPYADHDTFGAVADFTKANTEYLSHTDNATLSVGDIDFVVAGWFYLKNKSADQAMMGQYTTTGNQRSWQIYYSQANDRFEVLVSADGSSTAGQYIILQANNFGIPTAETWYFIVLWHDATGNTVNIQVNNGTADSAAWANGVHNSTGNFTIGGVNGGSSDARMARAGLWKNGLLTADQRTWLYNSGAGRSYSEIVPSGDATDFTTGLIAHWRLNGDGTDAHTNGYNLTNNGSTPFANAGVIRNSGAFRKFAQFTNSATEYLSVADNADLSTGDVDWVAAAWVRITADAAGILYGKDDGTNREWFVYYDATAKEFAVRVYASGGSQTDRFAKSLDTVSTQEWYLVFVWHDATAGTINIEVHDEPATGRRPLNAAFAVTPFDSTAPFRVGSPSSPCDANIQSVTFWKGRLLTKAERVAFWDDGYGTDYPFATSTPFATGETGIWAFGKTRTVGENQTGSHTPLSSLSIGGTRYQVAGFWEQNNSLVLAYREIGGEWTVHTYNGTDASPSIQTSDDDNHDTVTVGLDPNGFIHVWYGMHRDALAYRRSTAAITGAWDGTLTAVLSMTGSNEADVTYPFAFNDPTGTLYIRYRDGGAVSGDWHIKVYTEGTETWAGIGGAGTDGLVVNGVATPYGIYGPEPVFTSDFNGAGTGEMFLIWVWQNASNQSFDYNFVKWNGTTTWSQSDGTAQTMPVTSTNEDTIITAATTVNPAWSGITYDGNGRPHFIYWIDVSGDRQMHHAYFNGTSWVTVKITSVASSSFQQGETFAVGNVIYTFTKDLTQDTQIRYYKSGDNDYTTWSTGVVYDKQLHALANSIMLPFHFDRDYFRASGTIHLLLQPWWADAGQKPITIYEWTPE